MSVVYSIPVKAAGKIIAAVAEVGVAPEELCRAVQIDLSALEQADNRIPFAQLIMLYEHAARLTGDDAFGLRVGELSSPKMYDVLGYVTMNSGTFGEALNRLIRYQQIWTDAVTFSLEVTDSSAHLSYIYQIENLLPKERRQESENMMSAIMRFGRMATGIDWTPREVHFEHKQPESIFEHEKIFRAPVRFSASLTKLIFDSSLLALPLVEADTTLGALLERQAEDLLAKSPVQGAFINQVRKLIGEALHGGKDARLEIVSQKLGISSRTLQRKLREENTSYQELIEEMQRTLSKIYLQKPEMAICEVAYLIGFSQTSAFHRAFRRWTGLTPGEFRRAQQNLSRKHPDR
jgi:AraC-like DNA-binding protein